MNKEYAILDTHPPEIACESLETRVANAKVRMDNSKKACDDQLDFLESDMIHSIDDYAERRALHSVYAQMVIRNRLHCKEYANLLQQLERQQPEKKKKKKK